MASCVNGWSIRAAVKQLTHFFFGSLTEPAVR
jgi:hypothetical protein